MGTRATSDTPGSVALYDSVTNWAFGPVFDRNEDIDDFLDWLNAIDGRDPRTIPNPELSELQARWRDQGGMS